MGVGQLLVVGKSLPKVDAREMVTGRAHYAADIRLPGMLQARVLRSPHPHAKILRIDTTQAERLSGVRAVITAQDTPQIRVGMTIEDQFPLALEKVRFIGDEVAAVAAIDQDIAEEALDLIHVEYEELPAVFDPEEAMQPGAPRIHDTENNIVVHSQVLRGDIEGGFREADFTFEDRFVTSLVHQAYLEPRAVVADCNSGGKVTLWASIQNPYRTRAVVAKALGLSESKVRIIQPFVGGGFGGKLDFVKASIAALLSQKVGRAVKLVYSREEEFTSARPRVPMIIELRMGFRRDGTITARQLRLIADSGAYAGLAPGILYSAAVRADSLYRQRNLKTEAYLVYTNKVPTGPYRGFGVPQIHFAVESQMDMVADRLGLDPAELRLKNATRSGDVSVQGWLIRSCSLEECIEKCTGYLGWEEKRAKGGSGHGVGLACMIYVSGSRWMHDFDGSSALVKVNEDGKVNVLSGEGDVGQGARTVFAQIAAEELGVGLEDVEMAGADTDITPVGLGAYAGRLTLIGGNAVKAAVADAKRQLFEAAAGKLEANIEDLESRGGRIYVRGSPERGLPISEAVKACVYRQGGAPVLGRGAYDADSALVRPDTLYGNISAAYPFAAQVAEVEVDAETGQVKVLNVASANDLGRAINPMAAEGQVEGAVAQGLGYAFLEEEGVAGGRVLNPNFLDYKIPTALDVPQIKTFLVESMDPVGPYGAKAVGEPGQVPVAPAIANAIYHAVGVRIKELPITPEKVLRALQGRGGGEPSSG